MCYRTRFYSVNGDSVLDLFFGLSSYHPRSSSFSKGVILSQITLPIQSILHAYVNNPPLLPFAHYRQHVLNAKECAIDVAVGPTFYENPSYQP
jgi:hypothetical protein